MSSAFLRRLATMSAIAVALALAAGLGPAGPAAHAAPPPRLAEAGPSAGASHAVRPASVRGIECFYVYPECSSSDPSVYSNITNLTDTSTCTFEWTAVWGDGQSDTVDVNGGPAGTLEYTFTHKYDSTKPDTYHLTISGIVTGNSDPSEVTCSAVGATPTFNLTPAVGLAALRFAPLSGTALTTPGLAVIKDDGPRTKIDTLDGPDKCDGVAQPESYDYLACQSPVPGLSGPSDKEWPVIFPVGSKFSVNKVVFVANGPVKDPQLTANVSVPGSGFYPDLADAPMTVQKKGNVYELTAKDLTFAGGTLPVNLTGRDLLYISWTITEGDTQIDLAGGDEHFTVYVPAAPYAPPLDGSIGADEVDEPYESLIDVGTVAAAGQTTEQGVFDAIWKAFATRDIAHPILDPKTGAVTDGPTFKYYDDQYPDIADWFNKPFGYCPAFTKFLTDDSGHCGNFAEFLAGVLAFQGITAKAIGLASFDENGKESFYPNFNPGPDPAKGIGPGDYAYMLVGSGLWKFSKKKNAPTNYPYRDNLKVSRGGKISITGSGVTYKSATPIAQGPVTDPPMMFRTGDHAIVGVSLSGGDSLQYVDPSYGNPQTTVPYSKFPAYEKSAIAGFAVIYKKVGNQLIPLKVTARIATECAPQPHVACYFQAVPYP